MEQRRGDGSPKRGERDDALEGARKKNASTISEVPKTLIGTCEAKRSKQETEAVEGENCEVRARISEIV